MNDKLKRQAIKKSKLPLNMSHIYVVCNLKSFESNIIQNMAIIFLGNPWDLGQEIFNWQFEPRNVFKWLV